MQSRLCTPEHVMGISGRRMVLMSHQVCHQMTDAADDEVGQTAVVPELGPSVSKGSFTTRGGGGGGILEKGGIE